jgi:twinkle protein
MIKIVSIATKNVYEIDPRKGGENYMPCPECSSSRSEKNKRKKSFSWNDTKKAGKCHHCDADFVIYLKPQQKEYDAPAWKNITELTDNSVKWFTGRMIRQDVLSQMKIYSDVEFMPQAGEKRSVICFPYFRDGKLVNIKFRDGAKNFKLSTGAELILYNIDAIKGQKECIIVEGEIDALSYIACGHKNVVSVPNGAGSNLDYLDNAIELFEDKDKIYIATDNDPKGIALREELVRRFGAHKCLIVNFQDCKDANEFLIKNGGAKLFDTIRDAIEIPMSGIVNLAHQYDDIQNLYINGLEKGLEIGCLDFDNACTWELGRLAVLTGIPSHGKSELLDFILVRLNMLHGIKVGYFSPENYPIKYHYMKLASKIVGKEFKAGIMDNQEFEQVYDHIKDNFFFVFPEDDMSADNILSKAKYLVKKRGIKVFVIDPYNKIEHMQDRGETETNYISKFLDKLTMFARSNNVLVFLVAHPRKMGKNATGHYDVPNLYDINGSANFYNKADYGISVYRVASDEFNKTNEVQVHFLKIKFRHLGNGGMIKTKFNYKNGRYETEHSDVNSWHYNNYLSIEETNNESDMFVNTNFDEEIPF